MTLLVVGGTLIFLPTTRTEQELDSFQHHQRLFQGLRWFSQFKRLSAVEVFFNLFNKQSTPSVRRTPMKRNGYPILTKQDISPYQSLIHLAVIRLKDLRVRLNQAVMKLLTASPPEVMVHQKKFLLSPKRLGIHWENQAENSTTW